MLAAALAALAASGAVAADVRIAGTDLLGIEFSKSIYAFAGRNQLRVALALDGSRPALEELKSGRADLALLVLPAEEEGVLAAFHALVVAYQAVVVLAPVDAEVDEIGIEQLAAVFGAGMKPPRWGELGARGGAAGATVELWIPEVGHGIGAEFFRHAVLAGRDFRPGVMRYSELVNVRSALAASGRGLVLASGRSLPGVMAKALALKRDGGPGVPPTAPNLHDGSYPLRLTVRVALRRDTLGALKPILSMLAGEAGATAFEHAGWVPLPPPARARQLLALESR